MKQEGSLTRTKCPQYDQTIERRPQQCLRQSLFGDSSPSTTSKVLCSDTSDTLAHLQGTASTQPSKAILIKPYRFAEFAARFHNVETKWDDLGAQQKVDGLLCIGLKVKMGEKE